MFMPDPFVPDRVRLIPDSPIVEPDAVVLPAVLAPVKANQLFSAAAPGAATDAVIIEPAEVPKVTLFALEKLSVVKLNDPFEADATGVAPPPGLTLIDIPFEAIVPDALVPAKAALACTKSDPLFDAIAVVRYAPALSCKPLEFRVNVALVPVVPVPA